MLLAAYRYVPGRQGNVENEAVDKHAVPNLLGSHCNPAPTMRSANPRTLEEEHSRAVHRDPQRLQNFCRKHPPEHVSCLRSHVCRGAICCNAFRPGIVLPWEYLSSLAT